MIATTIEQSKRLLKAGVSKESADMRWEEFPGCIPHLCYQPDIMPLIAPKVTPAWSLSALWELAKDLDLEYNTFEDKAEWIIEHIVSQIEKQ